MGATGKINILVLISSVVISCCFKSCYGYDNLDKYKVYRLVIKDKVDADYVQELSFEDGYDTWSHTDIMVSPEKQADFEKQLNTRKIEYNVMIHNVQTLVDKQMPETVQRTGSFNLSIYHTHEEINSFLDELVTEHPTLAQTESIGLSLEGRNMLLIKITSNNKLYPGPKRAIWLDCGIHAREWISPATCLYIINELVTMYGVDSNITDVVDHYEWFILPSANPDGYEYTWSTTRLFRKTRHDVPGNICIGVDPNRNFDWHHCERGALSASCASNYCGPYPFSEVEVANLRDKVLQLASRMTYYINIHSYGLYWLLPWGHTTTYPTDYEDMMYYATRAADALKEVHGTVYDVGTIPELLYLVSGGSCDWVKGVAGVKYSYSIELPDTGEYGFLLPPEYIIPTGEETVAGVIQLAKDLKLFGLQP